MSVISTFSADNSNALAKRYADLAGELLAHPAAKVEEAAGVPLENLFRILEMFRHDAFSDESRRGVLTMVVHRDDFTKRAVENTWSKDIERALSNALAQAYSDASKEEAIEHLQDALRALVSNQSPAGREDIANARIFFGYFSNALAAA